jgi:hypothetical protein
MLDNDRKKIIERVAKLLALADNKAATGPEAQAARAAAFRLMDAHNVSSGEAAAGEPFERRTAKGWFEDDVQWDRRVRNAVARFNTILFLWCDPIAGQKMTFITAGRPSDLDAYDYMLAIVIRQRTQAYNDYARDGGTQGKAKWLYAYAVGFETKIATLKREHSTQLARTGSQAIARLTLMQEIENWYRQTYGDWKGFDGNFGGGRGDGFGQGHGTNLYRGEMTRTRQIGQQRYLPRK